MSKKINTNIQTLHCHTTTSDGEMSHLEILDFAEKLGISTVAFTDHDSVPNKKTITLLNKNHKTKWIIGIEISSGLPKELKNQKHDLFHIVGLFVNPLNKNLLKHCKKVKEARIIRMQKTIKNLNKLNFKITEKECIKIADDGVVGRPHIAKILLSKKYNHKIIEKYKRKMEMDAKKDKQLLVKYNKMIVQGFKHYLFDLFLTSDSYIPNIYVDINYIVDMDKSVQLIRDAGGLAILAHYSSVKDKINYKMFEQIIKHNRLDGAETIYALWTHKTIQKKEYAKDEKFVAKIIKKYNKIASGGVDAHKKQDFLDFINSNNYAKQTTGMIEKIIKQANIDLKWSSLKNIKKSVSNFQDL